MVWNLDFVIYSLIAFGVILLIFTTIVIRRNSRKMKELENLIMFTTKLTAKTAIGNICVVVTGNIGGKKTGIAFTPQSRVLINSDIDNADNKWQVVLKDSPEIKTVDELIRQGASGLAEVTEINIANK